MNLQSYFDFLNIGNSTFYYFDDPSNLIYGEDFEGAHGWVFINDSTNKWVVGTATSNGTGTKSLYISDDNGVTNKYDRDEENVSHAYKQIAIPAGTGDIAVSFDWRCYGEGFSGTPYDYFKVWLVAESVTPVAGVKITAGANKIALKSSVFHNKPSFVTENLVVNAASFAGQNARLVFEWVNDYSSGNQPPAAIDNLNITTISCSAPAGVNITTATTTSLTIGWTAPAVAPAGYEVYYATTNTAPTATTTPSFTAVTGLTQVIPELTANTTYYVWVRSSCGADGNSFWTGPLNAQTPCASITALPFTETFASTSTTKACWTVIDGNNDGDKWDLNYTFNAFVPNQVAMMYTDGNQGNNDDWLISPTITLTGNQRLKYHYRVQSVNEPNDFRVMLSTTGGQPVNFTHEIVAFASYNNTTYVEKVVNLVDANGVPFTGDVNIAWHVPQGGLDGWRLYIDNVIVEDIPSCPVPTGLGVTNINQTGATIAWTAGFNETAWEVSVVPSGTGAPTGNGTAVAAATYTPNDLNDSTQYEVYVRAVCAEDDKSNWIGPITFTTTQVPQTLPYDENFEGSVGFTFNNETTNKWVLGTAVSNGTGTKSMYISKDTGTTYEYNTNVNAVSHAYRDLAIPAGTNEISVSFDWKCVGETIAWDRFRVWLVPLSFNPTVGTQITANTAQQRVQIGRENYNGNNVFLRENIVANVAAFAGQNVRLVFEWRNDTWGEQPPAAIDNLNVAVITCSAPSALVLTGATTNTLTVGWTAPATAPAGYELYYSETNTAPTATSTPNITGVTGLSQQLTDLTDNTQYFIWVRSNCGADGKSFWLGPLKANTACLAFGTLPFTETFGSTSPTKACWTVIDGNNDGDKWDLNYTSNPFVADQVAMMYTDNNQGNNDDWLISPTITLTGNQRLKYHYRVQSVSEPNDFRVMVSTTGGQPANFTHEIVAFASYNNTTYIEKIVNLVDANGVPFTGDVNIAWHVPAGGLDGWRLYIDNVIVEEIPSCPDPTALALIDVSEDSIELSWTPGYQETAWHVLALPAGAPAPTAATTGFTAVTDNPYVITNLTPSTAYDIYVRANCGVDDLSFWIGPLKASTSQVPAGLPFIDDFEGTYTWTAVGTGPNAWARGAAVNNGGTKSLYVSKDAGVTYQYNVASSSVSQVFRDFVINDVSGELSISFDWKCNGETSFFGTKVDYFNVWLVPSSYTITPGTLIENTNHGGYRIVEKFNANNDGFLTEEIIIGLNNLNAGFVNGHFRIVFEWNNNSSSGNQPPAAIDNLDIRKLSCPAVIDLSSVVDDATGGALLSWTPTGDETQWEVFIVPLDADGPTNASTGIIVDEPMYLYEEGDEDEFYKFFVRPLCTTEDIGRWNGPGIISFVKPPGCAEVTAELEFNDIDNLKPNSNGDYVICQDAPVQVTLDATYYEVPSTTEYKVEAIDYRPPFPFLGGIEMPITSDDDYTPSFDLPFDFCFFGKNYKYCRVSDNGAVVFGLPYTTAVQDSPWTLSGPIPSPGFSEKNAIYGVFQDMLTTNNPGPNSQINYQVIGKYPCRTLVVNYNEVPAFGGACAGEEFRTTTQIVLYEITNIIEVYVKTRNACPGWQSGLGVIGIQNAAGTQAYTPPGRNTGAWSATEEAWRFSPDGPSSVQFLWEKDGEFFSNDEVINVSIDETVKYTATAIYEGCEGKEVVVKKDYSFIKENFDVQQPEDIIDCNRKPGELNVFDLRSSDETVLGDLDPTRYSIEYFSDMESLEAGTDALPDVVETDQAGTVFVKLTNKNTKCYKVKSFKLVIAPPVEVTKSSDFSVCESYSFPILEEGEAYYTKPFGEGDKYEGGSVFSEIGTHTIYIYKVSDVGCYGQSEFKLELVAAPVADIIEDQLLQCETFYLPAPSEHNKYFTEAGGKGVELLPGTEIILPSTIYIFAKIEGDDGAVCVDESSFRIDYEDCPIQKGISPNGDGFNDFFDLSGYGVSELKVYNRFGAEVFSHGRGYKRQWFGQDKSGNALPDGTYYYKVISNGKVRTGWVQINK